MRIILKEDNTDQYVFFFGILFFILSNQYFGWNREAQSGAEKVCDVIWQVCVFYYGLRYFVRDLVYEILKKDLYKNGRL